MTESKSMVIPNGVPNSSFLAYLLPMEAEESSTLNGIFPFSKLETFFTIGCNSELLDNGTNKTLVGATIGGSDNTPLSASSGLHQNWCSKMEYKIRPIPNEGSMTLGTNSSNVFSSLYFVNLN